MTKRYRMLLFDCVNTLYLPDPARLPRVELAGKAVPSTAALLLEHLRGVAPHLDAAQVHGAARASWHWAAQQRGPELREVPAPLRFRHFCEELGLAAMPEAFVSELVALHMRAVTGTFAFPPGHGRVLKLLGAEYRLGLLSNFDHGPSLRRLLEETGIARCFDPLLISDGLGYRKPGRLAFQAALERCGLPAQDVLFVGDSLEDDVQGSRGVNMDVVWINPAGESPPADCLPTHQIATIEALPALLAGQGGAG